MTDGAKFLKKKLAAQIWAKWAKIGLKNGFFVKFLKFVSLIFFEIAYSDSLHQCLTSRTDKIHEKSILSQNLNQRGQKSGLKLGFLPFSQVWLSFS